MSTRRWQKSSYCQEGEACVHISVAPGAVHLTDRPGPPQPVLTTTPAAFTALLHVLKAGTPLASSPPPVSSATTAA
ncbi:DUF397 domain-containing protein [Streptomyces cylindrosporus]|uniref:DUF397 domain-containing protein n=1 Tax=Streptomyces cylindrosporus TaxID=2927583 RepID=A0ABS9Y5T0_9ACTN|nr:DUF397 domain-containing protein [Streptomyces cylindrosporus]MCI3272354.1 DUF397 domain-containing protein [Streptomyces cylindrosporus]